jgi:dTDP-4-dehydrorhamnose reductase
MKILVLGASGMLGFAVLRVLAENISFEVWGSSRSEWIKNYYPKKIAKQLIIGVNIEDNDSVMNLFTHIKPNIVVNCIGLVKQMQSSSDPLCAIPINSIFPHRLNRICELLGARLIHISTDCVFSGRKGFYSESDESDATDLYGRSKYLGEVNYPNSITLRTSIIGHELNSMNGLISWFLSQNGIVKGYKNAIFSGLTTNELARVIKDYVIPKSELMGTYHVAAEPISKYDLLNLVKDVYNKSIEIEPDEKYIINRSLNAKRFMEASGYVAPKWQTLIVQMQSFHNGSKIV